MSPLSQFGADHPNGVRVHERDGDFSVAQHDTWLPGIYATEDAAVAAAALTDAQLATLTADRVVQPGDYRTITLAEVQAAP